MSLSDAKDQITRLRVDEIYIDHSFNTREKISPLDVIDLAKSIREKGLIQAITVRPASEHKTPVPPQYKYVVVAGHRRLTACLVAELEYVNAVIKEGLSDFDIRTINVVENLNRKELNPLEEAKCISHYKEAGWGRERIAQEIGMSPGWVQIREMILELPKEIQDEVAKGTFGSVNIRQLHTLRTDPQQQLLAARKLKEAKQKGENKTADQVLKKAPKANVKKQRVVSEIKEMMELYRETFGFDLCTEILAWVVGEVDNGSIYASMERVANERCLEFNKPKLET